ncbi:MAG TPA: hypothetical protein VHG08_04930 [Longimicrobium sp.]|nr:hypothetical protein [Longimicrobium sp.]
MRRRAYRTAAGLLVALGTVHASLTVPFYGELSPDAVWFAGTGLAMAFLGCLNLALAASSAVGVRTLCRAANVVGLAYGALAAIAVPEPQAYFGLLLLLAVTVFSFLQQPHDSTR